MEAVAALLAGLPLQPEESDRGDLMEAKSQLFLKYFTLFMNLLNDCSEEAEDKAQDPTRKRASSNLSQLRNCTVLAMSILLNANIDSGLMHSIGTWTNLFLALLINPYAAGGEFAQYKMMQKYFKMIETLANWYSSESTQQELSNEYQHDRVWVVFKHFCVLVLWTKVATALEGLR